MKIKIKTNELEELIEEMSTLYDDIEDVVIALGDEFIKELKKTYKKEQNPYKQKWAPLKDKAQHPVLQKTGKLLNAYSAKIKGNTLTLTNNKDYAAYHQDGTKSLPKRELLPVDELPKHWLDLIENEIDKLLDEKF